MVEDCFRRRVAENTVFFVLFAIFLGVEMWVLCRWWWIVFG